jgi:hypothetical protein
VFEHRSDASLLPLTGTKLIAAFSRNRVLLAASKPLLRPHDLSDALAGGARERDRAFLVEATAGIPEMSDRARRMEAIAGGLIVGITLDP